jgi:CRP-like cAMP-binding protein
MGVAPFFRAPETLAALNAVFDSTDVAFLLAKTRLFSAVSPRDRLEIVKASRAVLLGPGAILWNEGAPAESLGVVLSGQVKSIIHTPLRRVTVSIANRGDLLGTVALALASTYSTRVACARRARVLLIPASQLRRAMQLSSGVAAALAAELADHVNELVGSIKCLSARSVEQRVASVVLTLAARCGQPFVGKLLVPTGFSRGDMASLAGTTLESASRTISAWERLGIVTRQPAGLLLRDLDRLRAIAAGEPAMRAPRPEALQSSSSP